MATPKRGTSAYLRVYHRTSGVAQSSTRILHDCNGVLLAIDRIIKAEGTIIPDINTRSGNRRQKCPSQISKWGRKQMQK